MVEIFYRDGVKYRQYATRIRRLCQIENCNYPSRRSEFCLKHTINQETHVICKACLSVHEKEKSCKRCLACITRSDMKKNLQSPDYKTITVYENGNRYKIYPSGLKRKMCRLELCPNISCGEYCKKHDKKIPEETQKKCGSCCSIKDLTEFNGYESCSQCRTRGQRNSIARHDKRRRFLLELKIKAGGKCMHCGTTDLEILEFDHIRDKSREVRRIYNYTKMEEEAKKCILLCANCHGIKSQKDRKPKEAIKNHSYNYRVEARTFVHNYKLSSNGCENCGWFNKDFLSVLHFDHIESSDKEHNISRLIGTGRTIALIKEEIKKCRLLCANCHRKRTLEQFNYPIKQIIAEL